jgi:hypothetical protein
LQKVLECSECSITFWKVLKYLSMLLNVNEGSIVFKKVSEGFRKFQKVAEGSRMFRMFYNVLESFRIFEYVTKC